MPDIDFMKYKNTIKKSVIGSIVVIVISIIVYLVSPFFYFSNTIILGETSFKKQELINLSKVDVEKNIYLIDTKTAQANIKKNPYINEITIKRKFPETLVFSVSERVPAAVLPLSAGFVVIDEDGNALKIEQDISGLSYPMISGISIAKASLGEKIPVKDQEQFSFILKMLSYSQNARLLQSISDINLKDLDNIQMTTTGGIKVLLGDGEEMNYKMLMLNQILVDLHGKGVTTGTIDMRFKSNPVYREG